MFKATVSAIAAALGAAVTFLVAHPRSLRAAVRLYKWTVVRLTRGRSRRKKGSANKKRGRPRRPGPPHAG